ncbi:hypothetical protein ACIRSS_17440 [Amycolatopsis sp. NPDC101161]|uniref:hypothetical protein n=1 Tax=Amycolatopsis sp. NPDC101161 TaxID=3363940 RepID=UPI0038051F99
MTSTPPASVSTSWRRPARTPRRPRNASSSSSSSLALERRTVTETPELPLDPYPGLPKGGFRKEDLPRQARMALGIADEGVWSAAVETYLNAIDPETGKPDHDHPLEIAAANAVHNTAAACQAVALEYSAPTDDRAAAQEVEAAKHIAEAVDTIEYAGGIMHEQVTGPDGEKLDGSRLQAIHQRDEALARQRSSEGDARHTQRGWEKSWRLIAATLLGVMDALLLWKPLLNLSFEGSADNTFRWAIGVGMVSLQVLAIEWAARTFVNAERLSVDRRGAAGDHNRPLTSRRLIGDEAAPSTDDIAEADRQYSHAYHALVAVAAAVALVGGVRVAWLGRQADLPIYEATLFGIVIGLVLGCVVVQMARLYCRGNLLGDRLRIEAEAIDGLNARIKRARGRVSSEREAAHNALAAAEVLANHAETIRQQTLADYRRAVELAWTWFGLPPSDLDQDEFARRAQPVFRDPATKRDALLRRLDIVNQWLADRGSGSPSTGVRPPEITADRAGEQRDPADPVRRPEGNRVVIVGRSLVEIPERPKPPHRLMLIGAALTMVATVSTAWLAPAVTAGSTETAQARFDWVAPTD